MTTPVRLGTCSWADKGLLETWYPPGVATADARLRFYAERYDAVEVNASYYAIPTAQNAARWAERTPDGFTFHVKAFGLMTGHRVRPEQLPPDLRPLVDALSPQGFVEPTPLLRERVFARFAAEIAPLGAAGRMGGVLMQYPPGFAPSPAAFARIEEDATLLAPHEVLVEFRQRDWLAPGQAAATLDFLRRRGLTYVIVDAPRVDGPDVAQTVVDHTTGTGYVRFHGRNARTWRTRGTSASERFDYLYPEDELREWVEPLRQLSAATERIFALFNTNNLDQGPRNAALLRRILEEAGVDVAPAPGPAGGHQDALF